METNFDFREMTIRIIKYTIVGIIVSVAAFYIPKKQISIEEVVTIGMIAAATFSVIDLFSPSVTTTERFGVSSNPLLKLNNLIN
jgi:ABC-type Co2+ transport system permease subunit